MFSAIKNISPPPYDQVRGRLLSGNLSLPEVAALLSSDARSDLETIACAAQNLTRRRFGRVIKLYTPVYISNECINSCLYCGFRQSNSIERKTLTEKEILAECEAVFEEGHRHLLFVSGEHPAKVPLEMVCRIAEKIRRRAASITVEIMPQDERGYCMLRDAGVDGVTLYQETYSEEAYKKFHPCGPKSNFAMRLDGIESAAKAGMTFLGIGSLLGLNNWRFETLALVSHARHLMKKYWRSHVAVSVPRIRDSASSFQMPDPVSDADLAQMICTLRLALPDCGIVLSTRENAELRDRLVMLGVTQMSAGSVTSPGGRSQNGSGEQFSMSDTRTAKEVELSLKKLAFDPVWKDWDAEFGK
jgi:2-iminoacetate synthase